MGIQRALIERLVYGTHSVHRYTQDSPILADVWIAFGENLGRPQDLILTPRFGSNAAKVAARIRTKLRHRDKNLVDRPQVAYNQVYVVGKLYFRDVVRVVLPLTNWWAQLWQDVARAIPAQPAAASSAAPLPTSIDTILKQLRVRLIREMEELRDLHDESQSEDHLPESPVPDEGEPDLPCDLAWLIRLVGVIESAERANRSSLSPSDIVEIVDQESELFDHALRLLSGLSISPRGTRCPEEDDEAALVWLVNINRPVRPAVWKSRLAVKADAAQLLFNVETKSLAWAVIDSGIDARHPAFFDDGPDKVDGVSREWWDRTRVTATYDFTRIRFLLDPVSMRNPDLLPPEVQALVKANPRMAKDALDCIQSGRSIDWSLFKPFLRVAHDKNYPPPENAHGTHVAGILAANLPNEKIVGMCPDIKLYDLRVLKPGPDNDEFTVLAALQFVSWLNSQKDFYAVHGVNLSLSLRHDVANFACGRTPICDQCEDLVETGVVVVAAAGNEGYLRYRTSDGARDTYTEGYHTVSISDPGNARNVITVGSTHRDSPHTYGVSYFSGRGPTGDGRSKPDIVAPGEKIMSTVPHGGSRRMDGTSMAAPHVSGACAMLMARHTELIGQPQRIKEAICSTATDLGRERYFQGAGMLDVLRALQSI